MSNPIKIFELKGADYAKGLSSKADFPVGGIFNVASNFDPFDLYGYYRPSLDYAITDSSITSTPTVLTNWNDSGTAKIYSHTPTKLYEVLQASPYTTVDKTAQISVTEAVTGAIIFRGRYVYARTSEVRSNILPVSSGSDIQILSGFASSEFIHPLAVGPDKNLYVGDFGSIHQIVTVTTTSGNTADKYLLESGMTVRDMVNDGKYLVVIADNNTSHKISSVGIEGNFRCQVLFYDVNSGRSTADYIYEFSDSYLLSVKMLDSNVHIIGKNNFYVCNSVTAPRAFFNFDSGSTITEPPINAYQVVNGKNALYWCGQTNQRIYAYGSMISGIKKVFFQPYAVGHTPSAITFNGTNFYVGTSGANEMLSILNTGSTRTTSSFTTCQQFLPQPYKFAYAKVIMKRKLASGGQVLLGITTEDGNVTFSDTKLYSTIGAKQSIIFNPVNDTVANVKSFNNFALTAGSNQAIASVEVWATPIDDHEQIV